MSSRFWVKKGVAMVAVAGLVLGLSGGVAGKTKEEHKPVGSANRTNSFFEIKYGSFGAGSGTVEGGEYESSGSYTAALSLDFPVVRKFNLGAEISLLNVKAKISGFQVKDKSKDVLAGQLVGRYSILKDGADFSLRPEVGVGIGYLPEPVQGVGDTQYLIWSTGIEAVAMVGKKIGLGGEFALLWGKSALGNDYDVSAGAFPIFRAMLIFR